MLLRTRTVQLPSKKSKKMRSPTSVGKKWNFSRFPRQMPVTATLSLRRALAHYKLQPERKRPEDCHCDTTARYHSAPIGSHRPDWRCLTEHLGSLRPHRRAARHTLSTSGTEATEGWLCDTLAPLPPLPLGQHRPTTRHGKCATAPLATTHTPGVGTASTYDEPY